MMLSEAYTLRQPIAIEKNKKNQGLFFFFFFWVTGELSTLRQMIEGLCPNTGLQNTS